MKPACHCLSNAPLIIAAAAEDAGDLKLRSVFRESVRRENIDHRRGEQADDEAKEEAVLTESNVVRISGVGS